MITTDTNGFLERKKKNKLIRKNQKKQKVTVALQPKQSELLRLIDETNYKVIGYGGAQPLTGKIETPESYITMQNAKIGDVIKNPDGTNQTITEIHERGKLLTYEITFHDNTKAETSYDHLWKSSIIIDSEQKDGIYPTELLYKIFQKKYKILIPTEKNIKNDEKTFKKVKKIRKIGKKECKCITVSNPNGLYLMNNKIVTHNSNGGAKSFAVRELALVLTSRAYSVPIKILIFRRLSNDLLENHINPFFQTHSYFRQYFNKTERILYLPSGNTIKFGSADKEQDIEQFEGKEYDYIFIDESTLATQYMIEFLKTRNRSKVVQAKMILTMIPGFISHNYHKRIFVTREYESYENPDDYYYLEARIWDNVVWVERQLEEHGFTVEEYYNIWTEKERMNYCLKYSDYAHNLAHLPEPKKQARLYGDWNIFEGQFFDFNSEIHIVEEENYLSYSEIKGNMAIVGGLDYGNVTVTTLVARTKDGNYLLFDELYHEKEVRSKKISDLKEFLRVRGMQNITIVGDTNMWIKDGFDVDVSATVAYQYIESGIKLAKVSKSSPEKNKGYREGSNDLFHDLLNYKTDKVGNIIQKPKILVYARCRNFIRTFPSLVVSKTNPNDIEQGQEDHCFLGNTLVATKRGQIPIRDVKVGDYVWTREGFKKVLMTFVRESADVNYYPDLNLASTETHKIFTNENKDFIPISDLTLSNTYCKLDKQKYRKAVCKEKLSYSKVLNTIKAKMGILEGINKQINKQRFFIYIGLFGKIIIKKRFLKAIISIISTAINLITRLKTLNAFLNLLIYRITQNFIAKTTPIKLRHGWTQSDHLRQNGTNPKKEGKHILLLGQRVGLTVQKIRNVFVKFVALNTNHTLQHLSFAPQNVTKNGKETTLRRMYSRYVNIAGGNFTKPNSKEPRIAQKDVQANITGLKLGKRKVYNLHIEGHHEYYANNILVSNCYDSAKYAVLYLRKPREKKEDNTPEWLKELQNDRKRRLSDFMGV